MRTRTWRFVALAAAIAIAACKGKDNGMARAEQPGESDNMGSMSSMSSMSSMNSMSDGMSDGVEYTIVLKSSWTAARFPLEYPEAGAFTGPHFSGLIGASHNPSYSIFAVGAQPTPGLEKLSEEGKHTPLDGEIRSAIQAGAAGALVESGPLRDFKDSLVATVRVDADHPLVSLVAMIAPSPDWFTGVSNVNLRENGEWVASRTLDLLAYDSGGDDGTTYKAADQDANPKKATSQNRDRHFAPRGAALPIGTITITRNQ